MKRMNLIRVALIAVVAFMGSLSLSAQQSWDSEAIALSKIQTALTQLQEAPTPAPPAQGNLSAIGGIPAEASGRGINNTGCTSCREKQLKKVFLERTAAQIKGGVSTGVAVENVRTQLLNATQNAQSPAQVQDAIQQAYIYMVDLLS